MTSAHEELANLVSLASKANSAEMLHYMRDVCGVPRPDIFHVDMRCESPEEADFFSACRIIKRHPELFFALADAVRKAEQDVTEAGQMLLKMQNAYAVANQRLQEELDTANRRVEVLQDELKKKETER